MNIRVQGLLVILGCVFIGLVAGVVIERTRMQQPPSFRRPAGELRREGNRSGLRQPRLPPGFDRLNLTAEQRGQIDSIFQSWQPHTQAVMDSFVPLLRSLRDSAMADIERVLSPEQQQMLREMEPFRNREPFRRRGPGDRGR